MILLVVLVVSDVGGKVVTVVVVELVLVVAVVVCAMTPPPWPPVDKCRHANKPRLFSFVACKFVWWTRRGHLCEGPGIKQQISSSAAVGPCVVVMPPHPCFPWQCAFFRSSGYVAKRMSKNRHR